MLKIECLIALIFISFNTTFSQNIVPGPIVECRNLDSTVCDCLDSLKIHGSDPSIKAYAYYYDYFECPNNLTEIKENFTQSRNYWDLVPYAGFRYINTHIKIAKEYQEIDPDTVIHYLNKISEIPIQYENRFIDNLKETAFLKAQAYDKKGDFLRAYDIVDEYYQSPLYDSLYLHQQAWFCYYMGGFLSNDSFQSLNSQALHFFNKADSLLQRSDYEDYSNRERLYFNIIYNKARAYEKLGSYEDAVSYFHIYYPYAENNFVNETDSMTRNEYLTDIGATANSLGYNYYKSNQLKQAEHWYKKSIDISLQSPNNFDYQTMPFINLAIQYQENKQFQKAYDILKQAEQIILKSNQDKVIYPAHELEILMGIGNALLAMDSIDAAETYYENTKEKFFRYFDRNSTQESRTSLKEIYQKLFNGLAEIAYMRNNTKAVYHTIDQHKHSILAHDLQSRGEQKTTSAVNINDSDMTSIQYGILHDSLIAITSNANSEYKLHFLMPMTTCRSMVTDYLDELYNVNSNNHIAISKQLYALLISPLQLSSNTLRIIPIDILSKLPFETLQQTDNSNSLLLKTHNIEYQLSESILKILASRNWNNQTFYGFSPEYNPEEDQIYASIRGASGEHIDLNQLKYAQEEVLDIINLWNGDYSLLSKPSLTKAIEKGKSIHFSGHAISLTDTPNGSFLVLDNDLDSLHHKLSLDEIYDLKCENDLVVLSACETSYGKLYKSEGILSLSRAFLYAGAKSVVSTLWTVNDKASAVIMIEFHKQLLNGSRKDEALRQAKLTYLEQADPEYQHPYYWAGFIAMGDMSPLFFPHRKWYYLGLGVLGMLVIGFIFRKKLTPNRLAA